MSDQNYSVVAQWGHVYTTTLRHFLPFLLQRFSFFLLCLHSDINKCFQLIFISNRFYTVTWAKHGELQSCWKKGNGFFWPTILIFLSFRETKETISVNRKCLWAYFEKQVCVLVAFSLFTRGNGNGRLENVFKVSTLESVFVLMCFRYHFCVNERCICKGKLPFLTKNVSM